ncbi:MAG: hypothetical protein ABGY75_08985, partial [Gemmataceae bacterium]
TVGTREQYRRFLELCGELRDTDTGGARVLGGHLYGPYFHPPAKGYTRTPTSSPRSRIRTTSCWHSPAAG